MTMQRRVSPRFRNLANGGNSSFETISSGSDSKKPPNIRFSPRLQQIPLEKRPYYGCNRKKKPLNASQDKHKLMVKKPKVDHSSSERVSDVHDRGKDAVSLENGEKDAVSLKESGSKQGNHGDILSDIPGMTMAMEVKNKLRLFNKYYLHFAKEEEKRCNRVVSDHEIVRGKMKDEEEKTCNRVDSDNEIGNGKMKDEETKRCNRVDSDHEIVNGKMKDKENACEGHIKQSKCQGQVKGSKRKGHEKLSKCQGHIKGSKCKGHVKLCKCKAHVKLFKSKGHVKLSKRPDLKTISELKKNEVLCHARYFGDLPGIKVGHHFYSRAEMVAVGLHKPLLKGINYIGEPYGKSEYSGYTFPLAAAIVLSGQYEDDFDNREEIVYTGEGGNDLLGNKHQVKDQVLLRGNLALKNNKEQSVPVRVIRGYKCHDSYSKRLYIYDGLYKVTDCWDEKGISGFKVFNYRLKRLQGQDKMTSQNQVHFVRGKVSRVLGSPGLVCKDISNGQEDKCIPVLNLYNPSVAPTGFKYIKSIQVAKNVIIPPDAPGCNCRGKCTNPRTCSCAQLNGGDFPYVSQDGGRLFEAKDVVFECGPKCGCGPQCVNRTSQRGLRYRLEVFCTKDKGWAVRSSDFIPSGAPVCEYVGVLRKNDELEDISENDYIFEIDCWHTMKGIGGRERRLGDVSLPTSNPMNEVNEKTLESDPEPEFCIDASSFGNVARFINHSCDPNLFVQCILSSHHDVRLAHIVLFAADDIPPIQELTYDYNYAIDSVIGPDGKTKQVPCYCGTAECRKRLY